MKASAYGGDTVNVAIADCGHCDHEEVDTVPVTEFLPVGEVGRVSAVLQLSGQKSSGTLRDIEPAGYNPMAQTDRKDPMLKLVALRKQDEVMGQEHRETEVRTGMNLVSVC